MAKGKKKGDGALRQLKQEISDLKSKQAQAAKNGGKKKRSRNKNRSSGLGAETLRSNYARAVLDPFSVKGARVPDSFMLRTGTSFVRWIQNSSKPAFNFSNIEQYIWASMAPSWSVATKPLVVAGTVPSAVNGVPGSWFVMPATNVFNTATWCNTTPASYYDVDNPGKDSYRVTGGGLKFSVFGVRDDDPATVLVYPCFNGNGQCATWQDMVNNSTRSWLLKGKDSVTIPFPIRNTNDAYTWVKDSSHPGNEIDDYPAEDGPFTTAQLRSAFANSNSGDFTAQNTAITAWSYQAGMGGIQLACRLPPGAAWSIEGIVHIEYIAAAGSITGRAGLMDDGYEVCLSNEAEIEAVGNAACVATQVTTQNEGGAENPWEDLKRLSREGTSQVLKGVGDALADSQLLRRMTGVGIRGMGGRAMQQRLRN